MSEALTEVRAVRIICDIVLKEGLQTDLQQLGATGWTWWPAHGKGEHPTEAGLFNDSQRICVEVWCRPDLADKIVAYCNSSHFKDIGMAVGVTPIMVSKEQAAHLRKK
jgi:hypothetical protein